jgi:hypothetical protein
MKFPPKKEKRPLASKALSNTTSEASQDEASKSTLIVEELRGVKRAPAPVSGLILRPKPKGGKSMSPSKKKRAPGLVGDWMPRVPRKTRSSAERGSKKGDAWGMDGFTFTNSNKAWAKFLEIPTLKEV